ncbi:hypothetical protein MMC20_006028 [Loxospora ochrophaea]|nr:hypothetical protein [Loxospora ochrophaea]
MAAMVGGGAAVVGALSTFGSMVTSIATYKAESSTQALRIARLEERLRAVEDSLVSKNGREAVNSARHTAGSAMSLEKMERKIGRLEAQAAGEE